MTKTKLTLFVAIALVGVSLISSQAFSQAGGAAPANKIGLIDMEEVFKNYEKFNALQNDLKADMESSKVALEQKFKQLQVTEKQLKDSTFKKDSPQYVELESRFTQQRAAFEAEVKNKDRQFQRRQADIYKTIYGEVQDIVEVFAKQRGYALIMRFRRSKPSDDDPRSIAMDLNSSVVYHRDGDDITDTITSALNRHFNQTAGGARQDPQVRPAGGQKPAPSRSTGKPAQRRRPQ